MKIKHTNSTFVKKEEFSVGHKGKTYEVVIYLNEKDKFADEEITLNGVELEYEGTQGDLREAILAELDKQWDKLV